MLFDHGKEKIGWLFIKCVHMYHFHFFFWSRNLEQRIEQTPKFKHLCRFWFKRFEKNGEYKQSVKNNVLLQKYWYSQNCLTPFVKPGF